MPLVVAIDGPAGAGKSTVARRVAMELDLTYIDTGAMYRALAWKAIQDSVDTGDGDALARLARGMHITLSPLTPEGRQIVTVDGEEVTDALRTPEVSSLTSAVSALPAVRKVMVEWQRKMAESAARGIVLEGRDIGSVVFPNAPVKVFLTASPEERANRRYLELKERGLDVDYAQILADQIERDTRDSQRAVSPLVEAPDAVRLLTDGLPIDEVVRRIVDLCGKAVAKE